jgi:hypothetical protein
MIPLCDDRGVVFDSSVSAAVLIVGAVIHSRVVITVNCLAQSAVSRRMTGACSGSL